MKTNRLTTGRHHIRPLLALALTFALALTGRADRFAIERDRAAANPLTVSRAPAPTARNATLKTAGGPLIQAHRGGRFEYEDNAAGGFARSLKRGIRGFETDVRFTKDRQLVVMHDGRVNRTTDGTGLVEEMTLAELKRCRLEACSEPVPTAAEVFAALDRREDVFIEIEMKPGPGAFYTPEVLADYCRKLHAAARENLAPGTYAFTSFSVGTLETMRAVAPSAPIGYIMGALTDAHLATAKRLGCCSVAPKLATTREMVAKAHAAGLTVCLWMVQDAAQYAEAKAKGADRVTSDYPHLLDCAVRGNRKKLVAMDLDATLCQHRSPIPAKNLAALKALGEKYKCIMVGAGNAPRIYAQMGNYPIDIVGNYGMQVAEAADGNFRIVKAVTNAVDRDFFRRETDRLRAKYGYTAYDGEPLEFHASGMVTFGLLGTSPAAERKVKFDPDRKRRRAMYAEVAQIFRDYSVYIGGSTSFDFAGLEYNKYDATLDWAKAHGYALEDIVFIGDDFADGGGDSHVRIKDMDHIVIRDYKNFANAVQVLLKEAGCDKLIAHRGESHDAASAEPSPAASLKKTLLETGRGKNYYWAWSHTLYNHWNQKGDARHAVRNADGTFSPKPLDEVDIDNSEYGRTYAGGRYPFLVYADAASLVGTWHSPTYYAANRATATAAIRKQWKAHGAVMVFSWHMDQPYCTNGFRQASYRFKSTGANRNVIRQILDGTGDPCGTGSIDRRNYREPFANPRAWYLESLKGLAAFFNGLVDEKGRKIPVILRYPHEMDGAWFWWGCTWCTEDEFRRFCRFEADFLRKACGPDQILFAYTPDRTWKDFGREGDAGNTFLAYYPGDEYVDILGLDDYSIGNGKTDAKAEKNFNESVRKLRLMTAFARPRGQAVAVSESGGKDKRDDFWVYLHRAATADGVDCAFVDVWSGGCGMTPQTPASAEDTKRFGLRPEVLYAPRQK